MSKSIVQQEKELAEYQGKDRIISFSEMKKELEKKSEGFVISPYFMNIGRLTEGFKEGELILLAGKPKSGKSLMFITFTSHFAEQGEKILWFSYEMPARQFLSIFPDLPNGYMPRQLELGNIFWLEKKVYESKVKFNTRIVFIDHIHYLIDLTKTRNPTIEIGAIYRKLKLMAIKYHIIIFIISHLRKINKGEEPQMEDIRNTGMGAGEADTIFLLWRVVDKNGEIGNGAKIKVTTRRTGVMEKKIELVKKGEYLEEI